MSRRDHGERQPTSPAADIAGELVAQVAEQVDRLCWAGILLGLAFTMTNVQEFAADGARPWSLRWCTAWLLDPMVSLVLLAILRANGFAHCPRIWSSWRSVSDFSWSRWRRSGPRRSGSKASRSLARARARK